ncbi:uncharacterized protein LOC108047818 [Drosophila rhopaloa]|uniref:Uncharacterized protein LOC108047818 n=1 Tax=Drosophila rhopaloa TaxID=1041015 RepID=A0A6P4FDR4_DRORH|nr:uncharacterized protein LOC108047818 [Drosophila rhopaloa]
MSHQSSFLSVLLIAVLLSLVSAQYYTPYNPYYTPSPTFASLNNYYYSTTPYPYYYNTYTTPSPYSNAQIRIWPYVIGQYLYPTYYNTNYYNPYASLSSANWQRYYANVYETNWGKK